VSRGEAHIPDRPVRRDSTGRNLTAPIKRADVWTLPWGRLLRFDLMLLALLVLGTRLATFVHEFLGHALFVLLFGGRVNAIRISLLGGGHVYHDLPDGAGFLVHVVVAWAGIAMNLLTGAAVFAWLRRSPGGRPSHGFWILFAGASLLGGTAYAALGLYYGQGDPVAWMQRPAVGTFWWCLPFLVVSPFLGFVGVRAFLGWVEDWFPAVTRTRRGAVLLLTLGVASAAYAGLYQAAGARSRALDAPQAAVEQARKEALQSKREALARRIQREQPELGEDEVGRLVEKTPIHIRPEEIPQRPPLKPMLAVLFGAGGILALGCADSTGTGPRRRLRPRSILLSSFLAAGVLVLLGWTGGWVIRLPGF
jgi:hypothetical protein